MAVPRERAVKISFLQSSKPRHRKKDNIKMDLKGIVCECVGYSVKNWYD
jgi:hypothetical protein